MQLIVPGVLHSCFDTTKNWVPTQKNCVKWAAAHTKLREAEFWGGQRPPQNSRPTWASYLF